MDRPSEAGMALLLVTLALVLMSALGVGLVLTTSTEALVAGNYRSSVEARYAAEAIAERALDELADQPDWRLVIDGVVRSTFTDGEPLGQRTLPDGTDVDLGSAMRRLAGGRLYAYGQLGDLVPGVAATFYLTVVVAESPVDSGRLDLSADAVGPRGIRRAVELTLARDGASDPPSGVRVLSWRAGR